MGQTTPSRQPLPNPLDPAHKFSGVFTTPAELADGLWLVAFDVWKQGQDSPRLRADTLVKLRPSDGSREGLVAIHIGATTPLEPTAILSIETARQVALAIAADEAWDQFCSALPTDFAKSIEQAADNAAAETSNPSLPQGAIADA